MSGGQTQQDLDAIGDEANQNPSVVYMRQKCHPRANLEVAYHKALGVMICTCASCGLEVGRIAVSPAPMTRILRA
jgi:hypothetical protein